MTSISPPASRQSQHGGSGFAMGLHSRPKSSGNISVSAVTRGSDEEPKTAVKVAIRLRPPLDPSDPNYDLIPARFNKSTCHVNNNSTLSIDSPQGKKLFVFDRVFSDSDDQVAVWDYVSSSVESFVQGYNVSILAYGQSGAGKSYTMGTTSPGDQSSSSTLGIIPRAAAALFDKLSPASIRQTNGTGLRMPTRYSTPTSPSFEKATDKNWQLKATYVEIYNEQLRDLLVSESVPANERTNVTIREDTKGRIILTGLKQMSINSIEDLMNALNFGSSIRQTDATAINSKSSRSHAVFSLNLIQKKSRSALNTVAEKRMSVPIEPMNGDTWITIDSKLHFVDLAGSERLKNSGLTGDRVKEGISINAGLASLGKVISQLSSRASGSHVSYRDSRLTRLLQDSLGGNAITYMVACINPVEFHLSETLNTVQYAQRARAIQSRPQIQQRADEGDKQLIIDRLRSEIKFLREQIRSSQQSERRSNSSHDRAGRKHDRENELQEQLLDIQENYSALSQRHAKLVSELSKGNTADTEQLPALKSALESVARDRITRSNTFAEAVEQVILEYEKTIQSLETSLSNTRSSLSTSESNLLEREAKIVYTEAMMQQLQSRLQKSTDREQNSNYYARELETKLDSVSSGEEKQVVIIQDLRKELARLREGEASAEDYISTLEERLAEAEQDTEVMQREISRLEHVVERQRSVGKLDNLLSELDHLRHDDITTSNGDAKELQEDNHTDVFHDRLVATASGHNPNGELHPDMAEEEWKSFGPMDGEDDTGSQAAENTTDLSRSAYLSTPQQAHVNGGEKVHSPAQAKAIQDKLETLTMELFELRGDHESTVMELDDVSRKYQIALSTLAELQDAVDEARQTRPQSYLDRGSEQREDGPRSSSRMLSSEFSSRGESPTLVEASDAGTTFSDRGDFKRKEDTLAESVRALRRANAEKDININELTENYSQLQDQHKDTLNYIDELKEEMQRLSTPMLSATAPHNKRRSNMVKDRESRIFASLQNLALEHLHGRPEAIKAFESSLSAAMTESQLRTGRLQTLEAEVAAAKKEINVKNTMISGLTRERNSRSSVPTDMALVSNMRDHLVESHKLLSNIHESNNSHEQELAESLEALKATVAKHEDRSIPATGVEPKAIEADYPDETSSTYSTHTADEEVGQVSSDDPSSKSVKEEPTSGELQTELATWENKRKSMFEHVQSMEQQLLSTISGLETSLRNAEALSAEAAAAKALRGEMHPEPPADWEAEKSRHLDQVAALQSEINGYRTTAEEQAEKLKFLENSHAQIVKDLDEDAKTREMTENELQKHKDLVMNLEDQIDQQKSLATFHQQGLKSLQESHSRALDDLKSTLVKEQGDHETKLKEQAVKHEEATSSLQEELTKAHLEISELMLGLTQILEEEPDSANLHAGLRSLASERQDLNTKHSAAAEALQAARNEMLSAKHISIGLEAKVKELTALNEETLRQLEKSVEKEQKSSRIVQDLEEQLNTNFDQHKDTTNRLSSAQKERAEIEKELEETRSKVSILESQLQEMKRTTMSSTRDSTGEVERSSSNASALRKSNSQASLPSPPPAVPLPPLPLSNIVNKGSAGSAGSPPPSRHNSKEVATSAIQAQQQQQALEEQATRLRAIEKHLSAEKQLTQTLEEALMDLETQNNKTRAEMEAWKKKCREVEEEASGLRRERGTIRNSIQAVEEERDRRIRAEQARRQLEERMEALGRKGKKKNALNCF